MFRNVFRNIFYRWSECSYSRFVIFSGNSWKIKSTIILNFFKIIRHQSVKLIDTICLLHLVISSSLIHALDDPSQTPTRIRTQVPSLRGQLTNWAIPPTNTTIIKWQLHIWLQTSQHLLLSKLTERFKSVTVKYWSTNFGSVFQLYLTSAIYILDLQHSNSNSNFYSRLYTLYLNTRGGPYK